MNNFTRDLTMNVQDLQEVVHYERKDLMPEGERRVEFHAHTNMSTMDALPEVEEIVATAAKWGHKAVAITDHGNVQSFPHGYKAAKKAGIQLIYGMKPISWRTVSLSSITKWRWTCQKQPTWSLTWKRRDFQLSITT